jgi:hypothetical protein
MSFRGGVNEGKHCRPKCLVNGDSVKRIKEVLDCVRSLSVALTVDNSYISTGMVQ